MIDDRPDLVSLLALERVDADLFRSATVDPFNYLYGGQVAAQALLAAAATTDPIRTPHAVQCSFLRQGVPAQPVRFHVERDRDGRSYSARRVTAAQEGKPIFTMSASFHVAEDGDDEQLVRTRIAEPPEVCTPSLRNAEHLVSVEARLPTPTTEHAMPPSGWCRLTVTLPDNPTFHAAALLYLSDTYTGLWALPSAGDHPHLVSLNHSMWFHRPVRFDDWVLVDKHPVSVAGGRGLYLGHIYRRDGLLLATVAQESLFRRALESGTRKP